MIDAIIFDIGGVLAADVWEPMYFDRDFGLCKEFGLNTSVAFEVGRSLWDEFSIRKITESNDWVQLEEEYWEKFTNRFSIPYKYSFYSGLTDKFIKPIPGMIDLLSYLNSQKISIILCSDNTEFWFERQAEKLGIQKFVPNEYIFLSNRIGKNKKDPSFEIFKKLSKKLPIHNSQFLFIDDRKKNVEIAIQFGFPSILFPSNTKTGAAYLLNKFRELGVHK